MPDFSYDLFDTLATGTAALDALLFQTAQGADATHTEDFTNMRGAGSLPSSEKFSLAKIGITFDPAITPADLSAIMHASIAQLKVNDVNVLWIPLPALAIFSAYVGFNNLAAGAGLQASGLQGNGYEFKTPIEIGAGVKFSVRIKTTVATAASTKLVAHLLGTLSLS